MLKAWSLSCGTIGRMQKLQEVGPNGKKLVYPGMHLAGVLSPDFSFVSHPQEGVKFLRVER